MRRSRSGWRLPRTGSSEPTLPGARRLAHFETCPSTITRWCPDCGEWTPPWLADRLTGLGFPPLQPGDVRERGHTRRSHQRIEASPPFVTTRADGCKLDEPSKPAKSIG